MVLEVLIVFALGLFPPVASLLLMRHMELRAQERLRASLTPTTVRPSALPRLPADCTYVEGMGYLIGDWSCRFNARSTHIRCAVNPIGPCRECPYYEPLEFA